MGVLSRIIPVVHYGKARRDRVPPHLRVVGQQAYMGGREIVDPSVYANQVGFYNQESWVYACVRIISEALAPIALDVYQRVEERFEGIVDHDFERLLRDPNPYQSPFEVWEATHNALELTGNAYWYWPKNGLGQPYALYPLRPDRVKPVPDKRRYLMGYIYNVGGEKVAFSADEVVHFPRYHPLKDYQGLSALEAAAHAIEGDLAAQIYNKAFFKNHAMPPTALKTEDILDEQTRAVLQKSWEEMYRGSANAHKTAILEAGLEPVTLGLPQKDAEFIGLREMNRDEILAVYGVPKSKLGIVEDVNRSNAEAEDYTFAKDTLKPKLERLASKLNKAIMPRYGENIVVQFENVVPEQKELRLREQELYLKYAVKTPNEIRAEEGMSPVDWGDEPWTPQGAMMGATSPQTQAPVAERSVKAQNPLPTYISPHHPGDSYEWAAAVRELTKVNKKAFGRQKGLVLRALRELTGGKAGISSPDPLLNALGADWELWLEEAYPHLRAMLYMGADRMMKHYQVPGAFSLDNPRAVGWMRQWGAMRITGVNEETKRQVRELLTDAISEGKTVPEIEKLLGERFDNFIRGAPGKQTRAEKIARTETANAYNSGTLLGYQESGVIQRVKVLDDEGFNSCQDCKDANGQEWDLEFAMSNPLEHPNCVRAFAPVIEETVYE